MGRFLNFDEMVTPTFITIIYWIGIVLIVIGGVSSLFGGFYAFLAGVIGTIVGLVFWRVFCEMMLIVFRIHADLGQIARNTAPSGGLAPGQPHP